MSILSLFLAIRKCDCSVAIFRNLLNIFSLLLVDDQHWNNIAKVRRFLQRIGNNRLIFIDEIAIYEIMVLREALVAPNINH